MSVNAKMTAIADAIRAKTGGTEALTLDGMAEAIAALELGGVDWGNLEVNTGHFYQVNAQTNAQVAHGLSGKPNGFALFKAGANNNSDGSVIFIFAHNYKAYNTSTGGELTGRFAVQQALSVTYQTAFEADETTFNAYTSSSSCKLGATSTYYWIAWR